MAVQCASSTRTKRKHYDSLLQKTIKHTVSFSGKGLFTGEEVNLTLHPAKPGEGIQFQRRDIEGQPRLKALLSNVVSTPRCTIIGNEYFTIHTVEHILAALSALQIDNVLVSLDGPEVPILDGSCLPFIEALREDEFVVQDDEKEIYILETPVSWSQGDVHLIALPSDEYRVSYTLYFPHSEFLGSQYHSTRIDDPELFCKEIAPSRTFCLYEEITPFIEQGLIKGGGLDNAVIIKDDIVVNPEGIRFPDEMVRHKVLDLVGDFALLSKSFKAHIIAIRSGHAANVLFALEVAKHLKLEAR